MAKVCPERLNNPCILEKTTPQNLENKKSNSMDIRVLQAIK